MSVFALLRAVLSVGPAFFVSAYLVAGARAESVLGRKPHAYDLVPDRIVDAAGWVHSFSFLLAIAALFLWPLLPRDPSRRLDLPEAVFILGGSVWALVMGFNLGGYLDWYFD